MSVVRTEDDLYAAVAAYQERDAFAFDVETKGPVRLDPRRNEVFWIVLAAAGLTHVIPMGHPHGKKIGDRKDPRPCADGKTRNYTVPVFGPAPSQLRIGEVFKALEPLFYSDRCKVGHNLKFDLSSVQKYYDGRPIPPPFADTMVTAFLLNENERPNPGGSKPYSLGACVHREFGFTYDKKVGAQVEAHPFEVAAKYVHHDGRWTWMLWTRLAERLRKQKLTGIWNLEMDVLESLVAMETAGAPVDEGALRRLDVELRQQLDELEGRLYGLIGHPINLNSHAQKVEAFYTDQKLRPRKLTKGGLPSCDEDALSYYRERNKLIDTFLTFTEVAKLHSTYVNAYVGGPSRAGTTKRKAAPHVGIVHGRIHANFKQNGAATGRFSSSEPNLQNVPRPDTDLGKLIRGVFVAPPGDVLIVADWSQVEYRLLAQQSGDQRLIQAFLDGKDLHQANADDLGVSRSVAKNCNFAVVYGAAAGRVAAMSKVDLKVAEKALNKHRQLYPDVYRWRDRIVREARRRKPPHVRTMLGRRRRLPALLAADERARSAAERQAVNTVVQGGAADLVKFAMVRLHALLPDEMQLILTVHDELVVLCPEDLATEGVALVREAMEGPGIASLLDPVPLVADIHVVHKWSEAKA